MNMWRSCSLLLAILGVVLGAMLWPASVEAQATQVGVVILEMSYDSTADVYTLRLSVTDPDRVDLLIVRVVDENGTDVGQYHYYLKGRSTADVPIDGAYFTPGAKYTLLVQGQDWYGNLLERPGDNTSGGLAERLVLAQWEFTHRAEAAKGAEFTIQSLNPDFTTSLLTIDLDVTGSTAVSSYDGFIVNSSGQKVLGFGPLPFESTRIQVAMPDVMRQPGPEQEYKLTVNLTAANNMKSKAELEFKILPPKGPGFFERVSKALAKNPIIAVIIASVLAAAVTAAILFSRRKSYRLPGGPPPPIDRTMIKGPTELRPGTAPAPAAARQPRLRVRVVQTPNASPVPERVVEVFPVKFGRMNCDVNFPNDLKVSREHAQVTLQGNQLFITDLKSTNGTLLGQNQLVPQVPTRLEGTNRVRLGFETVVDLQVEE